MSDAKMPTPSVGDQVARQLDGARLRILIVGAGIAGATLAALLSQRGERVAVIERNKDALDNGYMLGLMPLGGRVLNGLNLAAPLRAKSLAMNYYAMHNRRGRLIRRYPMAPLVDRFGSLDGIERGDLLALLRGACGSIIYDASVSTIAQEDDGADVTFHDGSRTRVDLVVAADGMHSQTRALVLKPKEVEPFETGWGGWVIWSKGHVEHPDTYRELWAAGWGMGLYPVPGRVGIFLAGPDAVLQETDAESYAVAIEARLPKGPFLDVLKMRDRDAPSFYWPMADCRARVWSRGRVVLLGDAAAAFLPTAGVGASVAMDSAAALADELSRADAPHMGHALELYEKRQRHRVELAQQNSRNLARLMFVSSPRVAWARDQMMRFYTLRRLIKDISKVMDSA